MCIVASPQLSQHSQLELCNFAIVTLLYPPLLHWHHHQHHAGIFAIIALALLG
jgi:hypothetical protein